MTRKSLPLRNLRRPSNSVLHEDDRKLREAIAPGLSYFKLTMRRIGVTGGIAEGKSTVVGYLSTLGYKTDSADSIAKGVLSDEVVSRQIADLVGVPWPASPEQIRHAIAVKPAIRRAVNRLMHPLIVRRMIDGASDFVEVPLMIEGCIQGLFDEVWVVTCGREEQLRRLEARLGKSEAIKLMGIQLPSEAKEPFADHVIRTNRSEEFVFQEVRALARYAAER